MNNFKIKWENSFNSKDPLSAAKQAMEDIKSELSLCFTVTNLDTDEKFSVDLNESEGDEVCEISND